jgi:hypothetical protein
MQHVLCSQGKAAKEEAKANARMLAVLIQIVVSPSSHHPQIF